MPKINLGLELGQQTPSVQRGVPSVAGLEAGAESMARLAEVGADVALDFQKNRQDMETAKATTEALKEIEGKAFDFRHTDTDYNTQEQRYQEFYQDLEGRYQESLGDPQMFEQWRANVDRFAFNKGLDIKSNALQQDAIAQQATLNSTLSDLSGIAIRGDDEQFDETVLKAESLINHAFDVGVLDEAEKLGAIQKFKNDLSRGKVRQDINLDPAAALENIRANQYEALSAEEQSQFESMAMSKVAQTQNKARAEAKKQANELVSDAIKTYQRNEVVTDEEWAVIEPAAAAIGKTEELMNARAAAKYMTLPFKDRDGLADQYEGVQNVELRDALDNAEEAIQKGLDEDGYSFAVEIGVIKDIPLNFEVKTPEDLAELSLGVQARVEQTKYLEEHQFGQPVSIFKDADAEALVSALPTMSPSMKTNIALALGDSEAIWAQLDKKNAGLFAMTGAIGDPVVMEGVFKGQQLLKDKMVDLLETHEMLLTSFDNAVGDIYIGRDRTQMFEASKAYYAFLQGPNADFSDDSFNDAIEAVSGGIGKINGKKVELPRGVPESEFDLFVDRFTPEMVSHFGGVWGMSNEDAAEIIKKTEIRSYANNQYTAILRGDARLTTDGAKPFIFSYSPDVAAMVQKSEYEKEIESLEIKRQQRREAIRQRRREE